MKKTYILTLLLLFSLVIKTNAQEQDPRWELTQPIEVEIETYINNNIDNFELAQKDLSFIQESINHGELLQENLTNYIEAVKRKNLRNLYFQENPDSRELYKAINSSDQNKQICNDGGFEGTNPLTNYWFTNYNETLPLFDSCNMVLQIGTPAIIPIGINDFNNDYTLVSQGLDPTLSSPPFNLTTNDISRTFNGSNNAIKLNRSGGGIDVTHMRRFFNINEDNLSINFNLILQNPPGHSVTQPDGSIKDEQPFFRVRLYDNNGNIFYERCIVSDPNNCIFNSAGTGTLTTLYSGWQCLNINTTALNQQQVTLEFSIIDCGRSGHYGTVYIDEICNTVCNNSAFGNIILDPVNQNCPTDPFLVCGSFSNPLCSNGNPNFSLNLINHTGTIINTLNNSIVNIADNTFCFNVDPSDFGINPNETFEFEVFGDFITTTGFINTINDLSANVGPDVDYTNCSTCPTAGDNVTIELCDNDDIDYDLTNYLVNADSGGIWSYNNGIYNSVVDYNTTTINYTVPATPECARSTATITIILEDCSDPCTISDATNTSSINGTNLVWNDITNGDYTIQFIGSNDCPNTTNSMTQIFEYVQNNNSISLLNVQNDLQIKCFRWRIKTDCSDWSDWCLIGTGSTFIGNPFVFHNDCMASNPCDNYENFILISNDVLIGTTIEYLSYINIEATNIIQSGSISNYRASNSIKLKPGFHAEDNSSFKAYIDDCISLTRNKNTNIIETKIQLETKGLKIYPNPAQTEINLLIKEAKIVQYELYNIQGQLIRSTQNINDNKQIINVQELSRGFYILKVKLDDRSITNKNIILK